MKFNDLNGREGENYFHFGAIIDTI